MFWHIWFDVVGGENGVKLGVMIHYQLLVPDLLKPIFCKKSSYCVLALYGSAVMGREKKLERGLIEVC